MSLLRAFSAQSAIITFCGKHYLIDGTTALRISQTARDVATKVLGHERASAAFKDEWARRYAEVKEAGEQQWCTDQREELLEGGVRIFRTEARIITGLDPPPDTSGQARRVQTTDPRRDRQAREATSRHPVRVRSTRLHT